MFTLWVPVLQTGAFTVTLPAVIDNPLSDNNNSLPYHLILSFFVITFVFPVRVPVRTDVIFCFKVRGGKCLFSSPL